MQYMHVCRRGVVSNEGEEGVMGRRVRASQEGEYWRHHKKEGWKGSEGSTTERSLQCTRSRCAFIAREREGWGLVYLHSKGKGRVGIGVPS